MLLDLPLPAADDPNTASAIGRLLRYIPMQSGPEEASFSVQKESNNIAVVKEDNSFANATSAQGVRDLIHEPVVVSSDSNVIPEFAVKDGESFDASKQLVVYETQINESSERESVPDPIRDNQTGTVSQELVLFDPKDNATHKSLPPRILPSVGAFTVQCADCFKWRLIPTKEKYEEIREHILDQPFTCDLAREWRPQISCDDPPDIEPDGSRLWAIDKPSIARPPSGWERELRIRGEGSSKFADVYYIAPSGKKLRSMVEIQKYLFEHPEYVQEGLKPSRFSFQIPKPLQENYVRKRPSRALEPDKVTQLPLAGSVDTPVLRLGGPGLSDAYSPETPDTPPNKQQKTTESSPIGTNERLHNRIKIKIGHPPRPPPSDAI